MSRFGTYYARISGVRSDLSGLPPWARMVFVIVAAPGIALVALSFLCLLVSIFALLLLAIPVYLLLRGITAAPVQTEGAVIYDADPNRSAARRVEAKILESGPVAPDEINGE